MIRLLIALATAVFASGARAKSCDVSVEGAFARASATVGARSGVVYFSITNPGATPLRLTTLVTDRAERAELHEAIEADGVMTMRAVDALAIDPGFSVALAPGGPHVMLFGLTAPLKRGETIRLIVGFDGGCAVPVDVPVGGVAQTAPPGD